jgi:hypothetical protein
MASLAEELRLVLDGRSLTERQKGDAALAFPGEDDARPGAFKISSKALALYKGEFGPDWTPDKVLFTRHQSLINGLSSDDLNELFGAESKDKAQDFIAGKPKAAFGKWLAMTAKVNPQLGKLVRAQPDNAVILFYMTVIRVSGREMADIVLKRYFETQSDHIGAVRARAKVEELEEALDEAYEEECALMNEEAEVKGTPEEAEQNAIKGHDAGAKVWDKLKSGKTVWMRWSTVMTAGSGGDYRPYIVGRRSLSKKYGVESITLSRPGVGSKAMQLALRKREDRVTLSVVDMAAIIDGIWLP